MLQIIWFSGASTEDFSYWGPERRFTLLHIISWIIVGLIVGVLTRLLTRERDPMSWLGATVLGIAGSCLGGFIGGLMWRTAGGLLLSLIGSLLLLLVWRKQRSA